MAATSRRSAACPASGTTPKRSQWVQRQVRKLIGRDVQSYDDQWPFDLLGPVQQIATNPQLGQRLSRATWQASKPVSFLGQLGEVA